MMFFNQVSTILQMGFIYGIVAIGVYITYKILDIADLSVDGTFPLGGAMFAFLVKLGCPWGIAMIASFFSGAMAGFVTGVLHVKLKINALLSGIITMTALLSVNYLIAGTQISFASVTTLLNNPLITSANTAAGSMMAGNYIKVGFLFLIIAVCKIILDLFLKTKLGFMLRATGDNPQMVTQLGKNTDNYKMLGLAIANGFVALAGSLFVQFNKTYNSSMGTGTVVLALTCVIIGCVAAKHIRFFKPTTGVIVGSVAYYIVYSLAMQFLAVFQKGELIKLVVAVLFVLVLVFDSGYFGSTAKKIFKRGNKNAAS